VTPAKVKTKPQNHGEMLTAISDGMVALLKEFYGRGPTRAKSYYEDDLVVCVLRGGFSRVEQTLLDGGRGAAVINQRMEFQEVMRERFDAVIEDATGRRVIGFMSGNQQEPDMMCEVFVLAGTDLVDEHEMPAPSPARRLLTEAPVPGSSRTPTCAGPGVRTPARKPTGTAARPWPSR